VSGAVRCHVRGGLAHPQSEVRVGVKQQVISQRNVKMSNFQFRLWT
jgi:hypothetical protein